jgi:hypothetical protein
MKPSPRPAHSLRIAGSSHQHCQSCYQPCFVPRERKREVGSVGEFQREDLGLGELKIEYIIFGRYGCCLFGDDDLEIGQQFYKRKSGLTQKKGLFILTENVLHEGVVELWFHTLLEILVHILDNYNFRR